jgi:AcrR family transcriptional regulator
MTDEVEESVRLERQDWLRAGLDALAESGPKGLRATRLARNLGVTTGSFYWHFESVADFQVALLNYWEHRIIGDFIRLAEACASEPSGVLPEIWKLIVNTGVHRYDAAMRSWARADTRALDVLRRADEVRHSFFVRSLRASGIGEKEANDRANLMGSFWRGSQHGHKADYRIKLMGKVASP